jgi:hypothetical protein
MAATVGVRGERVRVMVALRAAGDATRRRAGVLPAGITPVDTLPADILRVVDIRAVEGTPAADIPAVVAAMAADIAKKAWRRQVSEGSSNFDVNRVVVSVK